MSNDTEQELLEFLAPLPQWLQRALWYDYSSMTDSETWSWLDSTNPFTADQLQELKTNPGWQPERYPQTEDELRPEFERILRRCAREKWNSYCQKIKAERERLAKSVPLPKPLLGRPRNDDVREEGIRLIKAGETWSTATIKVNHRFGAGTVTKESLRSLLKNWIKPSDLGMVKTKN